MKPRVAKSIARAIPKTIIWSIVLAAAAAGLVYVTFVALNNWNWQYAGEALYAAFVALLLGIVVFPLYWKVKITGLHHIVNVALTIIAWSLVLAVIGGIAGVLIGAPFAFASGLIAFTAYEVSKRVRFVRKQRDTSHHLVHQ